MFFDSSNYTIISLKTKEHPHPQPLIIVIIPLLPHQLLVLVLLACISCRKQSSHHVKKVNGEMRLTIISIHYILTTTMLLPLPPPPLLLLSFFGLHEQISCG